MSNPPGRFPDCNFPEGYGLLDVIEEGSISIYGLQPLRDSVKQVFILRAYRGNQYLGRREVVINHDILWGIDQEDLADLEEATEELLREVR